MKSSQEQTLKTFLIIILTGYLVHFALHFNKVGKLTCDRKKNNLYQREARKALMISFRVKGLFLLY